MSYFIFNDTERMIAFRYIKSRRVEGFISISAWFSLIGIAIGVATLIIVMSVMNGFHYELKKRILDQLTGSIQACLFLHSMLIGSTVVC